MINQHSFHSATIDSPEEQAVAGATSLKYPDSQMTNDDVVTVADEMDPMIHERDTLTGSCGAIHCYSPTGNPDSTLEFDNTLHGEFHYARTLSSESFPEGTRAVISQTGNGDHPSTFPTP